MPHDNNATQEINVTAFSPQQITDHRFEKRRRGYDTAAVDQFIEDVARHVERLQNELAGQATDRTALDLLNNAERIARDTRLGAEIDANRERETAARELDQARLVAAGLTDDGRSEAARIVREAEAEAGRIVTKANAHAGAIHQTATRQSAELRQKMQEVSEFITESAADLRLGASRLVETADRFESELTTRNKAVVQHDQSTEPPDDTIELPDTIDLRTPADAK